MGNDTICGPNAATSALPPPRSRRAADGSGHPAGWGKRVPMARPAPLERGTAGGIPGRPQPKRARPLPLRYVHTRRGRPHPQKGDVHTRKRGTSPPAGGGVHIRRKGASSPFARSLHLLGGVLTSQGRRPPVRPAAQRAGRSHCPRRADAPLQPHQDPADTAPRHTPAACERKLEPKCPGAKPTHLGRAGGTGAGGGGHVRRKCA